jgi:integrase
VAHLRGMFALARAVEMTTDQISRYVTDRQAEGAANATINRELAALKRMFRLGERAGKVGLRPYVPMLREDNTRTGFFDEKEFRAILKNLPEDLRPVFEVAYITGWRVRLRDRDSAEGPRGPRGGMASPGARGGQEPGRTNVSINTQVAGCAPASIGPNA